MTAMLSLSTMQAYSQEKLKVAVVGLSHDHAHEIMRAHREKRIQLLGVAETDNDLIARYKKDYNVPGELFFSDTKTMLEKITPNVVMAYNPINEHLAVAEICLPMGLPLMVEKPLATTLADAQRMAQLAEENGTLLLTNFETTWYESVQRMKRLAEIQEFGGITKMIAKDGHEGPREIGCSEEFLAWLTDPIKNGGGAVMDFGCYGANLMTWMQGGERPISVTATTLNRKPEIYPKVDDDATIILEYQDAIGIIEASWDWPYSIKSLEIFGDGISYHAPDGKRLEVREQATQSRPVALEDAYYDDHISYLEAVLTEKIDPGQDLSSLSNNLIVMEILEAAKKSAETGERVKL